MGLLPSGTSEHCPRLYQWSAAQRGCIYWECCLKPGPSGRKRIGYLPTAGCCSAAMHRHEKRVRLYLYRPGQPHNSIHYQYLSISCYRCKCYPQSCDYCTNYINNINTLRRSSPTLHMLWSKITTKKKNWWRSRCPGISMSRTNGRNPGQILSVFIEVGGS